MLAHVYSAPELPLEVLMSALPSKPEGQRSLQIAHMLTKYKTMIIAVILLSRCSARMNNNIRRPNHPRYTPAYRVSLIFSLRPSIYSTIPLRVAPSLFSFSDARALSTPHLILFMRPAPSNVKLMLVVVYCCATLHSQKTSAAVTPAKK